MATKAGATFDRFAKCKILFRKRANGNSRTPNVGALRARLNHFHVQVLPDDSAISLKHLRSFTDFYREWSALDSDQEEVP